MLDTLLQDLRYAVRGLLRAPAFTVTAILTLAIAIAVNTMVFTLLRSLALRPMPVREPGAVVRIFPLDGDGRRGNLFSYPDFRRLAEASSVAANLAAYAPVIVTATEGESVREGLAYAVSANYFPLLGIEPAIGRSFAVSEEHDRDARMVIISHAYWTRAFAGSAEALGAATLINGHRFTIVGVGPAVFSGTEPLDPDFWVPLSAQAVLSPGPDKQNDAEATWLLVVGRLVRGTRPRTVEDMLNVVASRIGAEPGAARRRPHAVHVTPATFFHAGPELRPVIGLVLTVVGLVLVIACANIANLVLTRAAARQKEISIRVALGAGRWQIARHLLAESLVVAGAGGAVGLLLSAWVIRVLYPVGISLLPFRWARVVLDLTPDVQVAAYSLLLSALGGVAFGLTPLLQSSRRSLIAGLRGQATLLAADVRAPRIRRALVIVQIAVCFTLLGAAALAQRALQRTETLDLGFTTRGVVYTSADLARHGYSAAMAADLHSRVLARARAMPDVLDVALTTHVPLTGGVRRVEVLPEGHDAHTPTATTFRATSPGYFRTLEIDMESGRDFTADEASADAPVAIISDALARRFWPGSSALGRRIGVEGRVVPLTIVGVVRDAREAAIWRDKEIALYVPAGPATSLQLHLIARTTGVPALLAGVLRAEAQRTDPRLRFDAAPLDQVLVLWLLPSRVAAIAASLLGIIALAIATVGIYGVMAYGMAQRRHEIGVRLALGASPGDVRRLLLMDGGRLVRAGLVGGVVGAALVMRALAAFLPGAAGVDPVALAAATVVLLLGAMAGCYLPVRSAARQDPLATLRAE